ncbi:hypothetical protein CROQUDRAFT_671190 [Cronartium quercuum f. sp. fusiforme G11]|uniref:Uncharacterized protein n=1 Tax=Cronartium quercuum f. sp. fusiforme G11 TaxID=708437 RepID=A0A9P6NGE7_9BASI|nr:hypothetical protein CROQUDRAFT_671190 [Cronartium quercuum f. sp. fusiforme G11]
MLSINHESNDDDHMRHALRSPSMTRPQPVLKPPGPTYQSTPPMSIPIQTENQVELQQVIEIGRPKEVVFHHQVYKDSGIILEKQEGSVLDHSEPTMRLKGGFIPIPLCPCCWPWPCGWCFCGIPC